MFSNDYSDAAALKALGHRIAQFRLTHNKTQLELAKEAGISSRTLTRIEAGDSVQLSNLIRILRALKLLVHLDLLVPEQSISPVQQLKMQRKQRQRASTKKEPINGIKTEWSWGDDE